MTGVFLTLAIILEVIATTALKVADGFENPHWLAIAILGYLGAFYCLQKTLRDMPIGPVYAIWSGAGIALIAIAGWLIFKQALDAPKLAGMSLIIAGILVMNLSSI